MKAYCTLLALGLLAAVNAQDQCLSLVSKIPTCAVACIDKAASSAGCSDPKDIACQCKNTDAINAAALSCVLGACGAQQGLEVQSAAAAVCKCVASATPAAATSAAAASSSVAAPTSAATSAKATSTTAATTSKAAVASSALYPISQASDGQVQAATSTKAASVGLSPSTSPVPFTGAGVTVGASMSCAILAVMAAIAAI